MDEDDEKERVRLLNLADLLDSPSEEAFDRLTRLATRLLDVPISLISLVDEERQFFKSARGLCEPWAGKRETPLTHSFCKYVVASGGPIIVSDATKDPLVTGNLAVSELNVMAYVGVPIRIDGVPVGSFCAISPSLREWASEDIKTLEDLALIVESVIDQRKQMALLNEVNILARESQTQLELILNSTGEGLYGIDAAGCCTFANTKCASMLGYNSSEELLGKNMHDTAHHTRPDGSAYPREECAIICAHHRGNGAHVSNEFFWKKDGSSFPVEYWSYPILKTEGKSETDTAAVVTFIDITERLERERELIRMRRIAERASRQKSSFLASISHEIRTPMNAILGFSELLEGLVDSPKALRYLNAVRSSGESLLDLINDILDISKIEAGKLELSPSPLAVREFATAVHLLFSQQAAERNLELSIFADDSCPDYLLLDELRIRQIMLNLISNAIKFTRIGGVTVRLSCERYQLEPQHVILQINVRDTGRGIPDEHVRKLFKPYNQVRDADGGEGAGLGLTICRRLVDLMEGKITVESTVGEGSCFRVTLPMVEVTTASDSGETETFTDVDFDRLVPSRILVVDDIVFNRDLVKGYLEDSHHTMEFAANGQEGVDKVHSFRPDIVLMDIRMPVLNGREALRIIHKHPDFRDLPVIAVTASSLISETNKLKEEFDDLIRKPFSRAQLFQTLSAVIPVLTPQDMVKEIVAKPSNGTNGECNPLPDNWGEVHEKLLGWRDRRVPELGKSMAMGSIAEFACELYELSEDVNCDPLAEFARNLRDSAESFEPTKVERALQTFPALIEELRAHYD